VLVWPTSPCKVPLPSTTSTELRKVVFRVRYVLNRTTLACGVDRWALIDKQLCGLVDQLRARGYRHTLEAELRFAKVVYCPGSYDPTHFLPKFWEKGTVTIIDTGHGDRLLHTSTQNR